jgi:hypothetical protein
MNYLSILAVQCKNLFAISKPLKKKDTQEHSKLENLFLGKFNSIHLSKTVSQKTSCGKSKCILAGKNIKVFHVD